MGLFKKICNSKVVFSKRGQKNYKIVLSVESKDDKYILSYLDGKINTCLTISEKSIKDYVFLERTKNSFYKRYAKVDPKSLVVEMDTGDVGFAANTTDHGAPTTDSYATGDARLPKVIGGKKGKTKCKKRKKGDAPCMDDTNIVKRPKIKDNIVARLK